MECASSISHDSRFFMIEGIEQRHVICHAAYAIVHSPSPGAMIVFFITFEP